MNRFQSGVDAKVDCCYPAVGHVLGLGLATSHSSMNPHVVLPQDSNHLVQYLAPVLYSDQIVNDVTETPADDATEAWQVSRCRAEQGQHARDISHGTRCLRTVSRTIIITIPSSRPLSERRVNGMSHLFAG